MSDPRLFLQKLAERLDHIFNPDKTVPKKFGFALLVFDFDGAQGGRMNWVSNANRTDMIVALKEMVAQLEGRVVDPPKGKAN